jgi:hypothetical protein
VRLSQLLAPELYFRLQVELAARDELDDGSQSNLRALQADARRLLEREHERIDALCAALTTRGSSDPGRRGGSGPQRLSAG